MNVRDIVDSGLLCHHHHRNFLVYAITQKTITIFLKLDMHVKANQRKIPILK